MDSAAAAVVGGFHGGGGGGSHGGGRIRRYIVTSEFLVKLCAALHIACPRAAVPVSGQPLYCLGNVQMDSGRWMFVVSAIAYLDRVNLSIAGRAIEEEFHLTDIQLGYVLSAFVLGYARSRPPEDALPTVWPRLVLTLGVVWWAVFTVLITLLSAQWPRC